MPLKGASVRVNMDSAKRADVLHELDINYQRNSHSTELLVHEEEKRRMRLRSMVLANETGELKEKVSSRSARIKALTEQIEDLRGRLQSAQEKCRRQEKLMQTQAREISNLKEEMSNLGTVTQDSSKLLSEKLALSRELAVLKPEIEHLKSQLAHQKDVLAEKLALERQLNTLEVELANEKRAAQKVLRKRDEESQEEAELRKQVQDLEKQLAKERKAAQKSQQSRDSETESELEALQSRLAAMEKRIAAEGEKRKATEQELEEARQAAEEAEKALVAEKRAAQRQAKAQNGAETSSVELAKLSKRFSEMEKTLEAERKAHAELRKEHEQTIADVETRQEAVNGKVDRLRNKLRETQEELRICRADLERAQEQTVKIPRVTTTTVPLKRPAVKVAPKKRPATQLEESILQTPGQDDKPKRPLKKRGLDLSAVEKSTFSITPFLNKTVNLSDESLKDDATGAVPPLNLQPEETSTSPTISPEPQAALPPKAPTLIEKKPRGRPKGSTNSSKPLTDSAPSKKNLASRPGKTSLPDSSLEKVMEEAEEEDQQENRSMESTSTKSAAAAEPQSNIGVPRLAGVSESEPKKKKRKLLGGANKPVGVLEEEDEGEKVLAKPVKRAVGGGKARVAMGGMKNAFGGGGFSPLKRDRRGVGASFLV